MQCLKLSEDSTKKKKKAKKKNALRRHHRGPVPALHSSDLGVERDKEQTPLTLCDESRGEAALRETAGLSPAAGLRQKQINADTRPHLMS